MTGQPGQPVHVFGEMALINQQPRSAAASGVAVSDKKCFLHLIALTPHFAVNVRHVVSERLQRASAHRNQVRGRRGPGLAWSTWWIERAVVLRAACPAQSAAMK